MGVEWWWAEESEVSPSAPLPHTHNINTTLPGGGSEPLIVISNVAS